MFKHLLKKWFQQYQLPRDRSRKPHKLLVEAIEDRVVPAFTATVDLGTGVVAFTGNNDSISFGISSSGFLTHSRYWDPDFASNIDLDSGTPGDQSLLVSSLTNLSVDGSYSTTFDNLNITATTDAYSVQIYATGGSAFEGVDYDATITNTSVKLTTGANFTLPNLNDLYFTASDGNNVLDGSAYTKQSLYLYGNGGNDTLSSHAFRGVLSGGDGDDSLLWVNIDSYYTIDLHGGNGNDTLDASGYPSRTNLYPGTGNDTVYGGSGTDYLYTYGVGDRVLTNTQLAFGTSEIDTLSSIERTYLNDEGSTVDIHVDASAFSGTAYLYGGSGNDVLLGSAGGGLLDGKAGNDTLDASHATGAVSLYGAGGDDWIKSGSGGSSINPGTGNDTVIGGNGTDSISYSLDADMTLTDAAFTASTGEADTLTSIEQAYLSGGSGDNHIDASAFSGSAVLYGNNGNDTLIGGVNVSAMYGGGGSDVLDATAATNFVSLYGNDSYYYDDDFADDVMKVGSGGSHMRGGTGNDTYIGGAGSDGILIGTEISVVLTDTGLQYSNGANTVLSSIETAEIRIWSSGDGRSIDAGNFTGTAILTGSGGNDTFVAAPNGGTVNSGGGVDSLTIAATSGNDTIHVYFNDYYWYYDNYVRITGNTTYFNYFDAGLLTIDAGAGIDRASVSNLNDKPANLTLAFLNLEPTLPISTYIGFPEGSTLSTTETIFDPGATAWTGTVDYGDGNGTEPLDIDSANRTYRLNHTYRDNGSYTLRITVTSTNGTGIADVAVDVTDIAPEMTITGNDTVDEGSVYSLTLGNVTDPGTDTVTTYTIRWGDGETTVIPAADLPADRVVQHTYADGTIRRAIRVDLTNEDGEFLDVGRKTVTVENVEPTISVVGSGNVSENSPFVLTLGNVTDPGQDTISKYIIHWGDGQTTELAAADMPASREFQHTYPDGSVTRTITIDLEDEDSRAQGLVYTFDSAFGTGGTARTHFPFEESVQGYEIASTPTVDGDLIVFTETQNGYSFLRFNADGTPDTSFGVNGRKRVEIPNVNFDTNSGLTVDDQGRILLSGYRYDGGNNRAVAVRFTANGDLDTTFGTGGVVSIGGSYHQVAYDIALDATGRILLTGYRQGGSVYYDIVVIRLLSDGTLDTSFGTDGSATADLGYYEYSYSVAPAPDGSVTVLAYSGTYGYVFTRFAPTGVLDSTFGTSGLVQFTTPENVGWHPYSNLVVDANGRLLISGTYYDGNNSDFALIRYTSAGALDTTFGVGGVLRVDESLTDGAQDVTIDAQGRFLLTGSLTTSDGFATRIAVVRLLSDGSRDSTFGSNGVSTLPVETHDDESGVALAKVPLPGGKLMAMASTNYGYAFLRYNADGTLDTTFGDAGRVFFQAPTSNFHFSGNPKLAVDDQGRLLIAGYKYYPSTSEDIILARYTADGLLDKTFGDEGIA